MTIDDAARRKFLEEYRCIRYAEGRGSDHSEYYRSLPYCNPNDKNVAMWAMRAKTYEYFVRHILEPKETLEQRALDILDLGAGNCWLSHRLSVRKHLPVAIDIFDDPRDGLAAARHYPTLFPKVVSDFDRIPLPSGSIDLAVFNASFHYSSNYVRTLDEAKRCLRPTGSIVILDSPIYDKPEHGARMVEEKHSHFFELYGYRSDTLASIEYLDIPTLHWLQQVLNISWQIYKPWYGWRWHLRPLKTRILNRRPPSKFWILVGRPEVR